MTDPIREALAGLLAIVDDSQGVAGYHLSGNIAEWGEFTEVEAARTALNLQAAREPVLDDFELEDMAHSALQEGLSFGVNLDLFMRLAWRVASVAMRLPAAQEQNPWIPVSERLPEADQYVLLCTEFGGRAGDWRYSVGALDSTLLNDRIKGPWFVKGGSWTPSHWMPLLAAPAIAKEGADHE